MRRNELRDLKKKDARAIFVLNQSVTDEIYILEFFMHKKLMKHVIS